MSGVDPLDDLVALPGPLLLGEMHGTAEIPALVRSLVDRAVAAGRRVRVGLELPPSALGPASTGWWRTARDGRGSRAMADLVRHVEQLSTEHDVACLALDTEFTVIPAARTRDEEMAAALVAATRRWPDAFVVALVGNVHSRVDDADCPIDGPPMAMVAAAELPTLRSLLVVPDGGFGWGITDPERPGGPYPVRPGDPDHRPGVRWWPAPVEHHEGHWCIGPVTPSPPAADG
jgi:hypothetical protein